MQHENRKNFERKKYKNIKKSRKKKTRRKRRNRAYLRLFFLLFLVFVFLFKIYANNPKILVTKAIASITDSNLKKQDKYFDQIFDINEILKNSYSKDKKEADEFLKANYKNLEFEIIDQEKTEDGLIISLEISNVNYIDIFDSLVDDGKDFHENYIKALEDENSAKNKASAKLLLKRKFFKYKIYESKEFIDAILGGALSKYSDNKE